MSFLSNLAASFTGLFQSKQTIPTAPAKYDPNDPQPKLPVSSGRCISTVAHTEERPDEIVEDRSDLKNPSSLESESKIRLNERVESDWIHPGRYASSPPELLTPDTSAPAAGSVEHSSGQSKTMSPNSRVANWKVETPSPENAYKSLLTSSSSKSADTSYVPRGRTGKRQLQRSSSDHQVSSENGSGCESRHSTPSRQPERVRRNRVTPTHEISGSDLNAKKRKFDTYAGDNDVDQTNDNESQPLSSPPDSASEPPSIPHGSPKARKLDDQPREFEHPSDDANQVAVAENYSAPSPSAREQERLRREQKATDLRSKGYNESEIALFRQITLLGLEPVLPAHWEYDFPSFPSALFTPDAPKAFISTLARCRSGRPSASHASATAALTALMELGARVRDTVAMAAGPERYAKNMINAFVRWTLVDAGLWRERAYLPTLAIVVGARARRPRWLLRRILRKMERLDGKWKAALAPGVERPTVCGLLFSHNIMIMGTLIPATDEQPAEFRAIGDFNFKKLGADVWHGLAIAILVTHCRNTMLDTMERHGLVEVEMLKESDPDV